MENVAQKSEKSIAGAIKINEKEIVDHLDHGDKPEKNAVSGDVEHHFRREKFYSPGI